MTKKRRRLSKPVIKVVSILVICVSIYLLIGVGKEVYSMIELQKKAEVAQSELNRLKEENATLISKRDKLEDPEYVQTYARGNYMFSKDGEQIFYLPSENDKTPTPEVSTNSDNK